MSSLHCLALVQSLLVAKVLSVLFSTQLKSESTSEDQSTRWYSLMPMAQAVLQTAELSHAECWRWDS